MSGEVEEPERSEKLPYLKGGSAYQNEVLQHAWEISNNEDFLCTILGENALLTHDRKHNYTHTLCWTWSAWEKQKPPYQKTCNALPDEKKFYRTHTDWGFGVSDGYHRWLTEHPRYKSDWQFNLRETYKLWKNGTRFYGQDNCHYTRTLIEWK